MIVEGKAVKVAGEAKGVFVFGRLDEEKLAAVLELGANAVFAGYKNLSFAAVKRFRDKGLKVYVEVGLFSWKELTERYPDARAVDREGGYAKKIDWYIGVCPNNPQVRAEKLEVIKRVVSEFPIDGIWLDFVRYPGHWEVPRPDLTEYCFCPICLEKFEKDVGGKPEGEEWLRWRCDQITGFAAETRRILVREKRRVELGLFAVPWQDEEFGGAIKRVIGQDFERLSEYIDVFSPMTYHRMCGRRPAWIAEMVYYFWRTTKKPVLPLVQTEDKPGRIEAEEFGKSLEFALQTPSSGVIVFFLENLLKSKKKTKVVEKIFKADLSQLQAVF